VVFKLKPRDEKFFAYFEQLSDTVYDAAVLLREFFENSKIEESYLDRLYKMEERGDRILAEVMDQINNSFITPFDREDILMLARELNNIVDHITGTMEKVIIYKAGRPKDAIVLKMVKVLEAAAQEIREAIGKLPDIRDKNAEIVEACENIRFFEHEGDYLYRSGIALLFENTENVIDIIKWKEIYEHLEATLDYSENVSNLIKGVAVKYV
jgi:uncharacterized protein Yka (UPF0111/DUF47 family)